CADKMKEEHGNGVFLKGCPVCLELCCCGSKTIMCNRQNHCYRKCPATKGKNFSKDDLLPASGTDRSRTESSPVHDLGMEAPAPALEILANVISLPSEDGAYIKGGVSPRDTQPTKRKFSDSIAQSEDTDPNNKSTLCGDHSSAISPGRGFHSMPASVPSAPGWTIANGMHHGVPFDAVTADAHRLGGPHAPPAMVFPSPNLLALRKKTLENPAETPTILLLGSANADLGGAGSTFSAGPGAIHHNHRTTDSPRALTSSSAWHGPASPAGAKSYLTATGDPAECTQGRKDLSNVSFHIQSGLARFSALSPRDVSSTNKPTLNKVLQTSLPVGDGDNPCAQQHLRQDSTDSTSDLSKHTASLDAESE
ncbi:unnamed protein product, partial [Symbiodinium microadriaticum]